MMDISIELQNYENLGKILDSRNVIVQDAGYESDMVRITVGDTTVRVNGEEMIQAVERCMRAWWPY